jgi:hypothetical protein
MFVNRVAFERNGLVLVVISEARHKEADVLRLASCVLCLVNLQVSKCRGIFI